MWSVSLGEVSVSMGSLLCSRSQAQSSEEARRQHFLWKKYRRGPGAGIRDSLVGKVTPKARFQGPVELSTGKSGRTESGASEAYTRLWGTDTTLLWDPPPLDSRLGPLRHGKASGDSLEPRAVGQGSQSWAIWLLGFQPTDGPSCPAPPD